MGLPGAVRVMGLPDARQAAIALLESPGRLAGRVVAAQQNICLCNARPAAGQGTERRGEGSGGVGLRVSASILIAAHGRTCCLPSLGN